MASSNTLFDMTALMQEQHPFPPQVGTDNAKELEFIKRGSSYTVATAGQKAGGRGGAVTFFHGSEAAWWTNAEDHFSSSVQSVDEVRGVWGVLWREPAKPLPFEKGRGEIWGWVKAPSEIWLETTSAGPQGSFFKRYNEAMARIGRYRHVFVPWTAQAEYVEEGEFTPMSDPEEEGDLSELEYQEIHGLSDAQMLWRRSKTRELGSAGKFRQEYQSTLPRHSRRPTRTPSSNRRSCCVRASAKWRCPTPRSSSASIQPVPAATASPWRGVAAT